MPIPIESIKIEKHAITTEAPCMREIMQPLAENFGITHFAYQKLYSDKTALFVTTSPLASKIFVEEEFYKLAFFGDMNKYHSCKVLGNFLNGCDPIIASEKKHCNIAHHFCIVRKNISDVEFFFFGSTPDNYQVNNIYVNHLDSLEKFSTYFKERAEKILKTADAQRILLPSWMKDDTVLTSEKIKNISIVNRKFFDVLYEDEKFTNKEQELLPYIARGYSAKEIAKYMDISYRTVEKHIANIKTKSNCTNEKVLIAKLANLNTNSNFGDYTQQSSLIQDHS